MSRASNSLKTSDVLTTPIKIKYNIAFTSSFGSTQLDDVGISILTGVNAPIYNNGVLTDEALLYRSIKHLYYSNYLTGSYQQSSSYADNWLQSTAASGTLEADVRHFPTESFATIKVMSIPREIFGEKVSKRSFRLRSCNYDIIDDGNGNLWDVSNVTSFLLASYFASPDDYFASLVESSVHVGNILYSQGIAVFTVDLDTTCKDPVDYFLETATSLVVNDIQPTLYDAVDYLLRVGLVKENGSCLCCPNCNGPYILSGIQAYLFYLEFMGLQPQTCCGSIYIGIETYLKVAEAAGIGSEGSQHNIATLYTEIYDSDGNLASSINPTAQCQTLGYASCGTALLAIANDPITLLDKGIIEYNTVGSNNGPCKISQYLETYTPALTSQQKQDVIELILDRALIIGCGYIGGVETYTKYAEAVGLTLPEDGVD